MALPGAALDSPELCQVATGARVLVGSSTATAAGGTSEVASPSAPVARLEGRHERAARFLWDLGEDGSQVKRSSLALLLRAASRAFRLAHPVHDGLTAPVLHHLGEPVADLVVEVRVNAIHEGVDADLPVYVGTYVPLMPVVLVAVRIVCIRRPRSQV